MKINSKKYYEAHKEARLAQIKAYQANSENYKVYMREYQKEYYKKRRAKLLEAQEQKKRTKEWGGKAFRTRNFVLKEGVWGNHWFPQLNTQKNYTLKNHYPLEAIETKLKEALEAIAELKT